MAQVEFIDLLRKVNQAVQSKVVEAGGMGSRGAGAVQERVRPAACTSHFMTRFVARV